ncbi:outer membrane lipoprotein-sorting protein [Elusimicrobium simillimum]|uniref:LolA family protein n=1 Tax=Elusimicrobium simillimum TaxID=3143438 RepID=UPI003C6F6D35
MNKIKFLMILTLAMCACASDAKSKKTEEQFKTTETVVVEELTATPEVKEEVKLVVTPPTAAKPAATTVQPAAKAQPKDIAVARLIEWDKKLSTLKTKFEQATIYDGVVISKSGGELYYAKPNKLRLDQHNTGGALTQVAVTDKKQIKIFAPDMTETTTLKWSDWLSSQTNKALFDFGNYTALINEHDVTDFKEDKNGTVVLTLAPKGEKGHTLYITLGSQDYFPQEISLVVDDLTTTATLTATQKNIKLGEVFKGI